MVTRAHGTPSVAELGEQLLGTRPPGDVAADPLDDPVQEPPDDLLGWQGHRAVLGDIAGRRDEVAADQRVRVHVRPRAAVGLDERVLALHPVRLGVDDRAVHVEQDGRGQRGLGRGYGQGGHSAFQASRRRGATCAAAVVRLNPVPGRCRSSGRRPARGGTPARGPAQCRSGPCRG